MKEKGSSPFMFSVDWEDFSQLLAKYKFKFIGQPNHDIYRQTDRILELCDRYDVKGTFFILGMLAEYKPDIVKKIQAAGHEIALHGYYHENLGLIDFDRIRYDISGAKKLVEDITGTAVKGYRAPFFSMVRSRLKVLDILSELGFSYDSSIFPSAISRFGIGGFSSECQLYRLSNGGQIVELPLPTVKVLGRTLSISGGSYMRVTPMPVVKSIFNQINRRGQPVMLYIHPYEFDNKPLNASANYPPGAPYSKIGNALTNLRWNLNRSSLYHKMEYLFRHNSFTTCIQIASEVEKTSVIRDLPY